MPDFSLEGRVAIITGGAGLLGARHAEAIVAAGGIPVLADIRREDAEARAAEIARTSGGRVMGLGCDVTNAESIEALLETVLARLGRVDILVNNAANNPKVEAPGQSFSRLERFPIDQWNADLAVGLTGPFLCARIVGGVLAAQKRGVIVNISSEYGMIAPDQRLYLRGRRAAGGTARQTRDLLGREGGTARADALSCDLLGGRERPGEHDLARGRRERAARRLPGARVRAYSDGTHGASRMISRGRSSTCAPTPRPS